jgi:sugar O-acyltransferase (sialic acid O-acetyltransferase NeuD family)
MNQLIIVGAGGLGREVLAIAADAFRGGDAISIKGFVDTAAASLAGKGIDLPILGAEDSYEIAPDDRFVMAIGDPVARDRIARVLEARGAKFISVIHPSAIVVGDAELDDGCVLAQNTFVAIGAKLAPHVFLNTYASVGHDSRIGRSCVLAPGAVVNGEAVLEASVLVGSNAVVTAGRKLGERARLGAGSVAYRNIASDCLAIGNPAKAKKIPHQ